MTKAFITVLIAFFANGAQSEPPQAHPAPTNPERERGLPQIPVVVRLQNANPQAVARTIGEVFPDLVLSAVDDTSVLVLRGPAESVDQARALIDQITNADRGGDATVVRLIHLRSARPQDVATQLSAAYARSGVTLSIDSRCSSLLVRGMEKSVREIADLVNEMDVASPNVSLEFSFLTAGPDKPDAGLELPPDLAEVGKELARFGTIKLMGRLRTVTTKDQQFEIEGMIAERFSVRVKGRLMSVHGEGALVELDAMAIAFRAPSVNEASGSGSPPTALPQTSTYNIRTTLQLKANHDLAVGVAPAGAHVGSSLVLVVRASW